MRDASRSAPQSQAREVRCDQWFTTGTLDAAETLARDPVPSRLLHFLVRAADEVPPQQDVLAEWLAADQEQTGGGRRVHRKPFPARAEVEQRAGRQRLAVDVGAALDRKSTRLNSS